MLLHNFSGRMVRILKINHPLLGKVSEPINDYGCPRDTVETVESCITQMLWIMRKHPVRPVGLSAPQIGFSWRLVAFKDFCQSDGTIRVIANPHIYIPSYNSNRNSYKEGCLSAPGVITTVSRYSTIILNGFDWLQQVTIKNLIYHGITAAIIQHEVDHLNGQRWPPPPPSLLSKQS